MVKTKIRSLFLPWVLIVIFVGCGRATDQGVAPQAKKQSANRVVSAEPKKEELLKDLLGLEGAVFSFAGERIETWIETSINDGPPKNHGILGQWSLGEEDRNVEFAQKLNGTIVLEWKEEIGESNGIHLNLRVRTNVGSDRSGIRSISFFIPENLPGTGIRQSAGPGGPAPTSANDVPLEKDLILLTRNFFSWKTGVSDTFPDPWDPKKGQKLTVTLKVKFVNPDETHETLSQ